MPRIRPVTRGSFAGQIALITGSSRGIGLEIARALAGEGARVIVSGRSLPALKKAERELLRISSAVEALACDVRDAAAVKAMFAEVRRRHRRIDILVNNAGISPAMKNIDSLPLAEWKDVLDTNLTGMFLVAQAALGLMKRGGTIVNNLSVAAKRVFPGSSAYNASKHGALGFTGTLREELRPREIRVIALLPGPTDTEIWNTYWPDAPRGRMMSARSVARAVVDALALPADSTVEELLLLPTSGTL
jgi:gluconate 5-dehydrogenase